MLIKVQNLILEKKERRACLNVADLFKKRLERSKNSEYAISIWTIPKKMDILEKKQVKRQYGPPKS